MKYVIYDISHYNKGHANQFYKEGSQKVAAYLFAETAENEHYNVLKTYVYLFPTILTNEEIEAEYNNHIDKLVHKYFGGYIIAGVDDNNYIKEIVYSENDRLGLGDTLIDQKACKEFDIRVVETFDDAESAKLYLMLKDKEN